MFIEKVNFKHKRIIILENFCAFIFCLILHKKTNKLSCLFLLNIFKNNLIIKCNYRMQTMRQRNYLHSLPQKANFILHNIWIFEILRSLLPI